MNQVVEEMKAILEGDENTLEHYGVKGMKWGIRRTPEQLGHHKIFKKSNGGSYNSKDTVFISGKVKFDEPLPNTVKDELNRVVSSNSKIIIGDAPGADTRVQDYLSEIGYKNVTVYTTDDVVRNNVGGWNVQKISGDGKETEREIRRQKDIAMTVASTKGIVISSDDDRIDSATSLNVQRLIDSNKSIQFYDFKKDELRSNTEEIEHNSLSEEIKSYIGCSNLTDDEFLEHYGMPRRSGRYPWGSGEDPYQHGSDDFLSRVEELKKNGWKETAENIRKEFGENVTLEDYRNEKAWCNYERRLYNVSRAKSLKSDGLNNSQIAKKMGVNESTVRSWFDAERDSRMRKASETADALKELVDKHGMIDVGKNVELEMNISRTRLDQALYKLKGEGYEVYNGRIPQPTNKDQQTTQMVLCKPGTPHSAIYEFDKIHTVKDYISRDGITIEKKFNYPESLDSKRLMVRYNEEGGVDRDGIVELRRGVPDLSLGESRYSQVRIMVDGTHYIKGMAVYSDDMPKGVDVIFNTNKSKGTPLTSVLKEIKPDPDNPFGSLIKDADQGGQYWYDPKTGKRVDSKTPGAKLGLINKRADEGDWTDWKDALPAQFLSKQPKALAEKQLNIAKANKLAEYEEICSLTNPTVKKYYLKDFADSCDSAAVHLQAAALPGQKYHVMIPINSLKDTEVYAPRYENGTKLALIRYPHGGLFEIPILTVNNKNPDARNILGTDPTDAVGVTKKVADRLSGADFDGDTVMCIPTNDKQGKVKIATAKELPELKDFEPKFLYGPDSDKPSRVDNKGNEYYTRNGHEYKRMKDTQKQMGEISNLITDMTLAGADYKEIARAVKHSMVVIDAEKHKLDYKASEVENNIAALKKAYQPKYDADGNIIKYGGASTLISRSKGEHTVDKRQGSPKINIKGSKDYDPSKPEGSLLYKTADDLYYADKSKNNKTGMIEIKRVDGGKVTYDPSDKEAAKRYYPVKKIDPVTGDTIFTDSTGTIVYKTKTRTQKSTNMAETDDAYTLVSRARHPMEIVYADYANSMKALANEARKEMMSTGKIEYNREAKEKYRPEVDSLMSKLNTAKLNSIRERAAIRMTNAEVGAKQKEAEAAGEKIKNKDLKKMNQQALTKYRQEVGGVSRRERSIKITDKEWEAIQAGAISESKLKEILANSDPDKLREKAMPRATVQLSPAKINQIKALKGSYTIAQIADKLNLSTSTVTKYLK